MLIRLDMASATPIYVQLRNQIVMGIGTGALKVGEKLPTVRQMAADAGVNTMTVELALLGAEAKIKGMNEQEFLQLCETIFENLSGQTGSLRFG